MFNILLLEDPCSSFRYPCLMSKCQITISIPTTLAWSKSGRVCSIDICDASKHLFWSFVGTGAGWTAFSPFSTLYLSNLTDKLAHLEQEEMQILGFGLALWFWNYYFFLPGSYLVWRTSKHNPTPRIQLSVSRSIVPICDIPVRYIRIQCVRIGCIRIQCV